MPGTALERYVVDLARLRAQPESTPELSLREPLLRLVREVAGRLGRASLLIAPEADAELAGQPDVFVKSGPRLVGFIETKSPGTDLGAWLRNADQARRYRDSLPNWIATDYYRFVKIRDGLIEDSFEIVDPASPAVLLPPAAETDLDAFFSRFFDYAPPIIRSPRRLALELARRARLLRDGIAGVLATAETGELRGIYSFYRETLISDLDEDSFAGAVRRRRATPTRRLLHPSCPCRVPRSLHRHRPPRGVQPGTRACGRSRDRARPRRRHGNVPARRR